MNRLPHRILSYLGEIPEVADGLRRAGLDVEVVPVHPEGTPPREARGDVLLTMMRGTPNLPEVLGRGVRWIHTVGTGVDDFPTFLLQDQVLTCSRGASAVPIAEWVLAQILATAKQLPRSWVHEPPRMWGGERLGGVAGSTVAILGFGSVGQAVAVRALAFGATVRALRRTDEPSSVCGVDLVSDLDSLLRDADHVVLAAPLTEATRGVVDANFLRRMPTGAHLVNVARSALVVEADLRSALDTGQLGVASLDVAPTEPLPRGHWFYRHPRVRFSPHVSWNGPGVWEAITAGFVTNFELWAAGRPLENVVDIAQGY